MTINTENMLESILESLSRIDYIKSADIPNIDLYMDQVTTFISEQMHPSKRHADDKVLTKTMINNYTKNALLPPPFKKKYSKEHVLILIFIYYFKNILSIKDIETLLKPITDKYFHTDADFSLADIYEEVCLLEKSRIDVLKEDIASIYNEACDSFSDADDESREFLQLFSFICSLSFDVYIKKLLIEKLVDELPSPDSKKGGK